MPDKPARPDVPDRETSVDRDLERYGVSPEFIVDVCREVCWQLTYGPKWTGGESELLERIDALLAETVTAHLLSDVPVGAFLSGGLDSTLVAAYAARTLGSELRTFSTGTMRPPRTARIGLIASAEPSRADAAPMRPPRLRCSSVST